MHTRIIDNFNLKKKNCLSIRIFQFRFELPLKIDITVRDNPEGDASESNIAQTHLLLNIIRPQDGVVLVISNTPPDVVAEKKEELIKLLRSQTGLLVEIDRLEISETK